MGSLLYEMSSELGSFYICSQVSFEFSVLAFFSHIYLGSEKLSIQMSASVLTYTDP